MPPFVNREYELKIVEEAFGDLLNEERLLRTPIIDFYGVEGVGKTTLLQQVVQKCHEKKVPHIWADADQNLPALEQSIITQATQYVLSPPSSEQPVIEYTKTLLERGPLVLLLDSIDTTNEKQREWLEDMLRRLIAYNRLFVVLSSRRSITFEKEKAIARKLKPVSIQPLDRPSSIIYLDYFQQPFEPEVRDVIFEWTRGHPLAMNIMIDVITRPGADLKTAQGQIRLINMLVEKITDEGLLKKVKQEDHKWIKKALRLLSIPRRFNMVIMQKLIETFEPELKQGKSLSYFVLLRWITQATEVLGWKMEKAGFAIEEPIRHLLLVQWKIAQPGLYHEINGFLADLNKEYVANTDRTRFQREYLYHSACSVDMQHLPALLGQTVQKIIQDTQGATDALVVFVEEFEQDTELKETLGTHINIARHMLYAVLAKKMYEEYEQEDNEVEKRHYLHAFFDYTLRDPEISDRQSVLKETLLRLLHKESAVSLLNLYDDLAKNASFREALGAEFAPLRAIIYDHISAEG